MHHMSGTEMGWLPLPGQTWLGASVGFVAMWVPMMSVMMLPVLVPVLHRYRRAIHATRTVSAARAELITTGLALGYFVVWAALGTVIFPMRAALWAIELWWLVAQSYGAIAVGSVVVVAGALQLTAWHARQLRCWDREVTRGLALPATARAAWAFGIRLGAHCCRCSAGLTAVLLVLGMTDMRVMVVVTAAISMERFVPNTGRAIGVVAIAAGLRMILHAPHGIVG
jgi:predicted metal-binding membrane protein